MSDPSALVYARYFELTRDHTDTDILSSLDSLPSHPNTQPLNCGIEQDCSRLLQTFEAAANEHLTLANGEPLYISRDVATFLQNCTKKADPNLHEIYQNLLPDPRYPGKHKLRAPLLLISGGDVHKDVRRIRKGINLDRVLDNLLEDYEETSKHHERSEDHLSLMTSAKILELATEELEKATRREVVEVSAKSLQYLKGVLCNSMSKEQITRITNEALPPTRQPVPCAAKKLAEDDFELDFEVSNRERVNSTPTAPEETESNLLTLKRETNDLLFCLDVAVEDEIFRPAALVQADDEMNDLLKQFTNHDFEELGDEISSEKVKARDFPPAEPPIKRRKLIHEQDDGMQSVETPSLTSTQGSLALEKPCWQVWKVEVPRIELESMKLPLLDLNKLASVESAIRQCGDPTGTKQPLPLIMLSMEDVMKDVMPDNIVALERYLGPAKPIVTSDKLLFKEPGLRVLDKTERDEDELVVEDYCLEEWKTNAFMEASSKAKSKSQTYFFENHDPKVKTQFDEQDQMPEFALPHDADAEAQYSIVEAELGSSPVDQQPLSPPQVPKNPFHGPAINLKFECNVANGPIPDPHVNGTAVQYADASTTLEGKPKETVAELLSRLRRSVTKQTKLGHGEGDNSPFESDSLTSFLNLRGKNFKARTAQRVCKEMEIAEDPIQSTQKSINERVDVDNEKPTMSQSEETVSLKEESEVLPAITTLNRRKTVILNNDLLQTKPLLVQFLERTNSEKLTLIYRDLNQHQSRGPDIILNPTTCLLVTNLQALNQRPLPGQKTATSLSHVHDHVAVLSQRYPVVAILVHYLIMADTSLASKQTSSMVSFASFCNQLTTIEPRPESNVVPIWSSCSKASSISDAVNAWVWQTIRHYAYDTHSSPYGKSTTDAPAALIQDETLWELFLVKAGINPMAAQIVIRSLKRPDLPNQTSAGTDPNWGLRKLVSMERSERRNMFDKLIGSSAVENLNHVLRDT